MSEVTTVICEKRLATLKAQLAMRGVEVYELASGAYVATRWGLTKHCIDIESLEAFARQIGANID